MFGLTELSAASREPQVIEAIIPTVAIPFLLIGAVISSLVTAVAAWFGVQLKADGPKRALELLLKPKVLLAAILLNAALYGGYLGYRWIVESSKPVFLIQLVNKQISKPSNREYPDNWAAQVGARSGEPSGVTLAASGANQFDVAWKVKLPDGVFRGFSMSGQSAFAGGLDGYVYELDRATGEIVRRFYIGKPSVPLPVVYKGTLFVGEGEHLTRHARVYAFDLKSGALRGYVQTSGHTEGDLVIVERKGKTVLFAAAGGDGLYAIDPDHLEVLWHAPIRHFDSGVAVSESGLVFASTGVEKGETAITPSLQALDFESGKEIWKIDLGTSGWSRPLLVGGDVCVGLGEIYLKARYGQVACFDQATGDVRLAMNFKAPVFETPQLSRVNANQMIVTDFRGDVCSVDLIKREVTWCAKTPQKAPFFGVLAQDKEGHIMITSSEGVHVLEPIKGTEIAKWIPDSPWKFTYAGVTVAADGWYIVDAQGVARRLVAHAAPMASR